MGDEDKQKPVSVNGQIINDEGKLDPQGNVHFEKKVPIKFRGKKFDVKFNGEAKVNKEGIEASASAPGIAIEGEKKFDGSTKVTKKVGGVSKTIEKDPNGNEKVTTVEVLGFPDKLGGSRHTTVTENGVLTEKTDELIGVNGTVGHKKHTKFYPDGKPKEVTEETFAGKVVTNKKHTEYDEYGKPTRTSEFKIDGQVIEYTDTDDKGVRTRQLAAKHPVKDAQIGVRHVTDDNNNKATKVFIGDKPKENELTVGLDNDKPQVTATVNGRSAEGTGDTPSSAVENFGNNAATQIVNSPPVQKVINTAHKTSNVFNGQNQKSKLECAEGNAAFCPPEQKPEAPPPEPSDGIGNNRPKNLTDRERLLSKDPNDKTSVNHFPKGKNGDPVSVAENLPEKAFTSLNKNQDYTDRDALANDVKHIMDLREAVHGAKYGQNTKAYHNAMQGDQQRLSQALTTGNPQLFTKLQNLALREHKQQFSNTPALNLDYSSGQRSAQNLEELSQNVPSSNNQPKVHPSLLQDQTAYTQCREFEKAVIKHVEQHNPTAVQAVKQHLADGFKTGEIYGMASKNYQNGQLNERVLGDYARPSNIQGANQNQLQSQQAQNTTLADVKAPTETAALTTPANTNSASAQTIEANTQTSVPPLAASAGGQSRSSSSPQNDGQANGLKALREPTAEQAELIRNLSPQALALMQALAADQNKLLNLEEKATQEKAEKIKLILANRAKGLPDDTPATPSPEVASKENAKDASKTDDKSSPQQAKNDPTLNGGGKEAGAQDTTQVAANKAENPNAAFDRAFARGQEATQQDRIDNPQIGKALVRS